MSFPVTHCSPALVTLWEEGAELPTSSIFQWPFLVGQIWSSLEQWQEWVPKWQPTTQTSLLRASVSRDLPLKHQSGGFPWLIVTLSSSHMEPQFRSVEHAHSAEHVHVAPWWNVTGPPRAWSTEDVSLLYSHWGSCGFSIKLQQSRLLALEVPSSSPSVSAKVAAPLH